MIGCGHRFIGLPPLGVLWLRAVPFPFVFARLRAKAAQGIVYLVEVLEGLTLPPQFLHQRMTVFLLFPFLGYTVQGSGTMG